MPFLRLALGLLLVWGLRSAASSTTSVLPEFFTPGIAFSVLLTTAPDAATEVYAVEETPPNGWGITAISHGGVFDPVGGRIRWGPFIDALPRVLSYQVTPPLTATGSSTFAGVVAFDHALVPITGFRITAKFSGTLVRTLPMDYLPGVAVAVSLLGTPAAGVEAWLVEDRVPAGWTVSSFSEGGSWDAIGRKVKWGPFFDATVRVLSYTATPATPLRSDAVFTAFARFDEAGLQVESILPIRVSQLTRSAPATYLPGVALDLTLTANPAPYVQALAVEDSLPAGWTPTAISPGGVFDLTNRKLKWGPFSGTAVVPATFSYQLVPAPGTTADLVLTATAQCDDLRLMAGATIVRFLVAGASTLIRSLPLEYRPSQPLTCTLAAVPIDIALVYGVEDAVPAGWQISAISHGGVFDGLQRRVKWGPFFDTTATPRALTYQATPPADAYGRVTFSSTARFDQTTVEESASLDNGPSRLTRVLPPRYTPGVPFLVALEAEPVPGIEAFGVEETVPVGWTFLSASEGGVLDPVNGVVKWGPFADRFRRTLTVQWVPPPTVGASVSFTGRGVFNQQTIVTTGPGTALRNASPLIIPNSAARPPGEPFKISAIKILLNDSDADGDFLNVTAVSPLSAHGATAFLGWPWIYYTPVPGDNTPDTITYTAEDGFGGQGTANIQVLVNPPPASAQNLISVEALPDGTRRITFAGVPGFTYHVEASSDSVVWQRLGDRTASTVGRFEFVDADAATFPIRFYRSVWP